MCSKFEKDSLKNATAKVKNICITFLSARGRPIDARALTCRRKSFSEVFSMCSKFEKDSLKNAIARVKTFYPVFERSRAPNRH